MGRLFSPMRGRERSLFSARGGFSAAAIAVAGTAAVPGGALTKARSTRLVGKLRFAVERTEPSSRSTV